MSSVPSVLPVPRARCQPFPRLSPRFLPALSLSLKPTADSAAKEGILGILVGHFPVLRGVSVLLRAAPSCGHRAPGWRQGLRHRCRERPWPGPASPVCCAHHGEIHVDVRVPAGGSARMQPRSQLALHIPYAAAASSNQRQTPRAPLPRRGGWPDR